MVAGKGGKGGKGKGEAPRGRGATEAVVGQVAGGRAELAPDRERGNAWTLLIDGAPQSHVDLDDPGYLDFAYQRRIGHLIDLVAPARQPLNVVHLGGGAFTLARYTAAARPRSTQQVVEIDAGLVAFVREHLPLGPPARGRGGGGVVRGGGGALRRPPRPAAPAGGAPGPRGGRAGGPRQGPGRLGGPGDRGRVQRGADPGAPDERRVPGRRTPCARAHRVVRGQP
ncbi:spermidine synthase, partial [Streptomyces goshikiensis]